MSAPARRPDAETSLPAAAPEDEIGGPTVTLDDLAAEIGMPVERVQQWLASGFGPHPIVPRTDERPVRFTRASIDAWLLGY